MHWVRNGAIALVLVVVAAVLWLGLQPSAPLLPINDRLGGAITLTDQHGESFNTAALQGKVQLLFFGYTHCPDICPATLARVTQAWRRLREAGHGDETAVVFVTFDPQRDTAEVLKRYLQFFDENIVGLTGSEEEIRLAAEKYGVVFLPDESVDEKGKVKRLYAHSDFIYLLDRLGRVRKLYPSDGDIEEMVEDAKSLL
ncbi:MAG: SCO family protein [Gammaproteobacteria bacterium]|mgnify:CR=1 FL=1|jgi:cytochrome oxidase Cu insertion factor (SCO1/SenC/PrrC family)|nr:SCO family protein [Gammaproteobacteria bacterium]MBQ0774589.1 SCO family protein [Gammaproteobacteria bacterium]|tara:strand:+ start:43584 stop:44180 length:597 start_codon:yes stop_codon:yes gene_type:complete